MTWCALSFCACELWLGKALAELIEVPGEGMASTIVHVRCCARVPGQRLLVECMDLLDARAGVSSTCSRPELVGCNCESLVRWCRPLRSLLQVGMGEQGPALNSVALTFLTWRCVGFGRSFASCFTRAPTALEIVPKV